MKTAIDSRLLEEAARFAFRFACEDCAYFVEPDVASGARNAPERCAHGYPPAPRRRELAPERELTFCKEFELR